MPITQSRMIATIAAGEDFRQGFEGLLDAYKLMTERIKRGEITPAEAFAELSMSAEATLLLRDCIASYTTLEREKLHFHQNSRRNERAAERMVHKRGGNVGPTVRAQLEPMAPIQRLDYDPSPPRSTAPKSINISPIARTMEQNLNTSHQREAEARLMREMGVEPGAQPKVEREARTVRHVKQPFARKNNIPDDDPSNDPDVGF